MQPETEGPSCFPDKGGQMRLQEHLPVAWMGKRDKQLLRLGLFTKSNLGENLGEYFSTLKY